MLHRMEEEPEQPNFTIRATLAGKQLFDLPAQIAFQKHLRTRATIQIQGMVIPGPGSVRFELKDGENALAYWDLIVTAIAPPQIQAVGAPA